MYLRQRLSTYCRGDTGITAMVCGGQMPMSATTGIASIGNGYYYVADGETTASLYRRDENYKFTRVTVERPAEEILHYSMDDADLYEKDGVTYMKDTLGNYDAVVQGTKSDKGAAGESDGSLAFNAWNYPAQPDRLYLEGEAIDYIQEKTGNTAYSYSFWANIATGAESDGNFDPFIGFYRADGTYAGVFEQRWRNKMKYVINGIGSATVGALGMKELTTRAVVRSIQRKAAGTSTPSPRPRAMGLSTMTERRSVPIKLTAAT